MFVTPADRPPLYNHVTATAVIPVVVHREDGSACEAEYLLNPQEAEAHHEELGRLIARRRRVMAAIEAQQGRS